MDMSITKFELGFLLYAGKFYFHEIACRKITNAKVFLLSGFATALCVYGMYTDSRSESYLLYGLLTPLLIGACFMSSLSLISESVLIIARLIDLHDRYCNNYCCGPHD